jgi:hypothetical protein
MGKIILSERQYKNLKKSLVSHSIEESIGKKPNLRLINEISVDETTTADSAGKKINKLFQECRDGSWGRGGGQICLTKLRDQLARLKTKEMFDHAGKFISFWYVNNWQKSIAWFLKNLVSGEFLTQTDAIKGLATITPYFSNAGGNLYMPPINDSNGDPVLNAPEKYTLTWKQSSTSTSNAPTAGKTINWEALTPEQIAGFQHWYWKEKEKDLPLAGGDENDVCTAAYNSALCGGRACTKRVAIDGKMGPSTTALMNNKSIRPTFETWWNTGTNSTDYKAPAKPNCGGVSYTNNTQKQPIQKKQTNTYSGGGGSTSGGGGSTPSSTSYLDWD